MHILMMVMIIIMQKLSSCTGIVVSIVVIVMCGVRSCACECKAHIAAQARALACKRILDSFAHDAH